MKFITFALVFFFYFMLLAKDEYNRFILGKYFSVVGDIFRPFRKGMA